MARRRVVGPTATIRNAASPFALGLGATIAAFVVAWRGESPTLAAMALGGGGFVALTAGAGWLTRDLIQGFVALSAGVALLPALATAATVAAQEDPSAPASAALLSILLASPGFMAGVIASGIAGRRERR